MPLPDSFASGGAVGIMQPYFFPYWGHFSLIAHTDAWVVFDIVQYRPKTWMNRNRILHPNESWQYLTVPLSNSSIHIKTNEARVKDPGTIHKTIKGKLAHYKKRAPHFEAVNKLVDAAFTGAEDDRLVTLNVSGLSAVCTYLDIPFNWRLCSQLDLDLPETLRPGLWAPEIAGQLGAKSYINPRGGAELFNIGDFADRGVTLNFLESGALEYATPGYSFEPNLSILDALMWNSPQTVADAVRKNCAITPA